jgi:SAM-dependent methyltransferase
MSTADVTATARPVLGARLDAAIYEPFLLLGEVRGMRRRRAEVVGAARGRVLEIGAGTGLNLRHFPAGLDELLLSEPDPGMAERLRRTVRRAGSGARVVQAGAQDLPLPDASVDTVVSTMVLCTVPHPDAALAEVARVLRPEGRLLFCEHVLSTDERRARRQRRWADAWAGVASGCRCDRALLDRIGAALDVEHVRHDTWRGMPGLVHPLVVGAARPRR